MKNTTTTCDGCNAPIEAGKKYLELYVDEEREERAELLGDRKRRRRSYRDDGNDLRCGIEIAICGSCSTAPQSIAELLDRVAPPSERALETGERVRAGRAASLSLVGITGRLVAFEDRDAIVEIDADGERPFGLGMIRAGDRVLFAIDVLERAATPAATTRRR
jgi:hypothetical protein